MHHLTVSNIKNPSFQNKSGQKFWEKRMDILLLLLILLIIIKYGLKLLCKIRTFILSDSIH